MTGTGRFLDPHAVEVDGGDGRVRRASADKIVIATGTWLAGWPASKFDERTVIDSDGIVHLDKVPRSMVVAGAGVIGIEYASMFAALGTKVTVVEQRDRMLEFCDVEVVEALKYHLRDLAVTFRFGDPASLVEARPEGAIATLLSGKKISCANGHANSAGLQGASDELNLDLAGLTADKRGRIVVDDCFRTAVPHIYAVGDVIGFPALAATSAEQGRILRRTTPAGTRCARSATCTRSASTASPRSASWGGPRSSSPRTTCPSMSGSRATASWPAARSSAIPTGC